jgi:hypothetical protein
MALSYILRKLFKTTLSRGRKVLKEDGRSRQQGVAACMDPMPAFANFRC